MRVCWSSSDPPGKFQNITSNRSQCFLLHSFQFTIQRIILPFDLILPEIITLFNKPLTYSNYYFMATDIPGQMSGKLKKN